MKNSTRSNYKLLKWMINYSRYAAKLMPKVQSLEIGEEIKNPWVELIARLLHMTISKLKRVDQLYA